MYSLQTDKNNNRNVYMQLLNSDGPELKSELNQSHKPFSRNRDEQLSKSENGGFLVEMKF